MDEAIRLVLSLNGTSGSISAYELQEMCQKLEENLRLDKGSYKRSINSLNKELDQVIHGIENFQATQEELARVG